MSSTAYADANDFMDYFDLTFDSDQESQINRMLQMASASINVALATAGMMGCQLAAWAGDYLAQLNIVLAGVMFLNPVTPTVTDEQRQLLMEWAGKEIEKIAKNEIELCAGETGMNIPYMTWAEHSFTEFNHARIILNDRLRKLNQPE